jgi:Xaa-Pro dipeptidase
MRIGDAEFATRRNAFAGALEERGLAGAVLFDTQYVHYYTGFFFIPTERPIAFALAVDGRGGMLVPRLELEHARANTAVSELAHYDEYPGERQPMEALRELLDTLGVRGPLGADSDGYPWVFGYRGPGLGEWTHVADLVEDQMAIKSATEI